jgi:hypothetical protein
MPIAANFPIQVKKLVGGVWSSTTSGYSPNQLDLWLNNKNGLLYVWQNDAFRLEDIITDEATTRLTPEGMVEAYDLASGSVTATAISGNPNAASDAATPEDYFPPTVTGKYSQIVKWTIDKVNYLRNRFASAGQANGLATLDSSGKIPSGQLPSIAGLIIHSTAPAGDANQLWIDTTLSVANYWNGTAWVRIKGVAG